MNRRVSKLIRKVFVMTMSAVMVFEVVNCSAMVAKAAEAYFYIKTDGETTDEKHPSANLFSGSQVGSVTQDIVDQNTDENNKLIRDNWVYDAENGVGQYIENAPSAEAFANDVKLSEEMKAGLPDKDVFWYIIKYESDGKIHVDGVLRDKPSEPEQPSEPEEPSEPEQPSEPEESEESEQPSEPEQPVVPEQPEVPEVPEQPVVPEVPEQPVVPEQPEVPEVPEQPVVPEQPEVPEQPVVPEQPEVPEQPVVPEVPVAANPTTPNTTPETQTNGGNTTVNEMTTPEAIAPQDNDTPVDVNDNPAVEIEEEETPLAPAINDDEPIEDGANVQETVIIEEEEAPLAAPGKCWIHWLILLLTAVYTVYSLGRGVARSKKIKAAQGSANQVEA